MSPLPHPHTPGNKWVGKCDYITKLIDPFALKESKLPINFDYDNPCKGFGRYLFEHWIHSRPYVQPCDLYNEKLFKFGYSDIPNGNFTKKLHMVPRFDFDDYNLQSCRRSHEEHLADRKWNYEAIYNITELDESWWGWKFFAVKGRS